MNDRKPDAFTSKLSRDVRTSGPEPEVTQSTPANGLGRVLVTVYLILALAATLRGVYQIFTKFEDAPVAYSLSLVSGVVYIVATIALTRRSPVWSVIAWAALIFELIGVLIVGTLSITIPTWFAHDSVWSYFGMNYFWIPLVLPVLGMVWLRQQSREAVPAVSEDHTESLY